jgi:hypothetical protein
MDQPLLSDEKQFPFEEIIYSHIGKTGKLWSALFKYIQTEYPDLKPEWRYYRDGKSWLMKTVYKSKTLFWLSVAKNSFKTTFYFTDRAEEYINKSLLPDKLKDEFKKGKKFNKIRGLTITFKNKKDIGYFKELLAIKMNIK